ncbi:hypothetical protein ACWFRJ_39310 [Streptomyces sp. NPDC055239]
MHRVDLAREADVALWSLPDDEHEEMLALIDEVADAREYDTGPMAAADAVLRGRCWFVYLAIGGARRRPNWLT